MKRKNLEKAIIMSLLAASVSVPVWAAEGLWDNANIDKVVEEGDLTVDTTGPGIGYNGTVNVVNGNLIVNSGGNGIAAGWMENATLNIYAKEVIIDSDSNGIFTTWGDNYDHMPDNIHLGNVIIGSAEEEKYINKLTIIANGQGIDAKKGSVTIYGSAGSTIDIHSEGTQGETDDQSAVNSGREKDGGCSGSTFIQGGTIKLTADSGSGIITRTDASSTVIDAADSVTITSKNTYNKEKIDNAGIKNMAGTTRIDAVNGITIDSSNNGIYATGGTVTLNGGSINRIDAVSNGIYASGKNTNVTLEAENNGIYVENNDGGATGVHTENGATKNIISEGKTEIIVSGTKDNILGIHADKNSTVNVNAGALSIDVTSKGSSDSELRGILVGDLYNRNGNATVAATVVGDIDIDVHAVKCDANGIRVNVDSDLDLTSNNGNINIKVKDNPDIEGYNANKFGIDVQKGGTADITAVNGSVFVEVGEAGKYTGNNHAVYAQDSNITITAGQDVVLNSYSLGANTSSNGGGIISNNGDIVVKAGGTFSVHSESDKNTANSGNYGLKAGIDGSYTGENTVCIDITAAKVDISSAGYSSHAIMMSNGAKLNINAGDGGINVQANGGSGDTWALYVDKAPVANLITSGNITLTATNDSVNQYAYGINSGAVSAGNNLRVDGANVEITAENKNGGAVGINAQNRYYASTSGEQWPEEYVNQTNIVSDKDIRINATSGNSSAMGVNVYNSNIDLTSENGSTYIISNGKNSYGILAQSMTQFPDDGEIAGTSNVNVASAVNNYVESSGYGVYSSKDNTIVNLTANTGSNQIKATNIGIYNYGGARTSMNAGNGLNFISSEKSAAIQNNGAAGSVLLQAKGNSLKGYNAIVGYGGDIDLIAANMNNVLEVDGYGIYAVTNADVDLSAEQGRNYFESGASGIGVYADQSTVDLQAKINTLNIAVDEYGYGSRHAIKAANKANVNLNAIAGNNEIAGVIYAKDEGTNVTLSHKNSTDTGSGSNIIMSSAHGSIIKDNNNEVTEDRSHVVSALYAQNKGQIDITAGKDGINHIESYFEFVKDDPTGEHKDDSERTVWAQRGGKINIEGTTIIKSSNAEDFYDEEGYATNSRGIAITAGTGIDLKDPEHGYTDANGQKHAFYEDGVLADVDEVLHDRSEVTINYGAGSAIYGDIVSGYGGSVNISTTNENSGLYMEGNALAGNGGKLTLDIGKGGTWFGRADDYGDAGYGEDAQHKQNFYNPVFSDTIYTSGTVDIKMGEGSTWYLTGQSWVSSLDVTKGNGNVTIDMAKFNKGTHGLTISDLKGINGGDTDVTFVMDLDHNSHSTSDMLYIKSAEGEYDVVLNDVIDGMDKISEDNVLRFATVQGGASFNSVTLKDAGLYNLGFEVGHSEYDQTAETENKGYNGSAVDTNKPGNENVEGFFDLNKNSEDNTQKIMLMDNADAAADSDSVQNWYITKVLGEDISDGGKTVVNMSKVNYSNAVYMDRLNKRLGEARYINTEEDQGMWVRMRHDRIGKDNEFRIMNTMYELGYDEKQECDNGERRVGAAIDYMDGSSEYTDVGGSGDVSRKGIWLYDTWLGDKGHYSDFVAKWGHLSNDFTLYRGGDKITGDFSNNVYSISAEYGRKKDIGNNWYFEPQVQLQYARVTDANYTTSQGTEVSLDAINSLIARAGFRLGKDLGERSTVYFKADLLHEFLGDQDIYAHDKTGTMDVTYGNEGTWCDIGFGFATAMSKTSYAYLDVETSLGNDYEETYQINAGLQWSF